MYLPVLGVEYIFYTCQIGDLGAKIFNLVYLSEAFSGLVFGIHSYFNWLT